MRTLPFILFASLALSCTPEQPAPRELAERIAKAYEESGSVSYEVDYRIKFFSEEEDTIKVQAHVDLIRFPMDTIFGGQVWMDTRDSIFRYYDTSFIYITSMKNEKITRYKKEDDWAINGNVAGDVIETYFLDPERLLEAEEDSTITVQLGSEEMNGIPVWHWTNHYDDDEDFKNSRKDIWISKADLSIVKVTYTVDYQGENQYNEWNLSNIRFGQVQPDDLKTKFAALEENYPTEDYQPRSPEEEKPLESGTTLPDLKGELYGTGDSLALSSYRGKLLLIDFWYMNCFPCIKAIPHLNELHHKYAKRGLQVIGINPYDNNEKSLKRMPTFLEDNPLDYPILFVNPEDPKAFKVFAYPTFYLVDRDGKVVFSQIGFGEETGAKVDSVIQVHL